MSMMLGLGGRFRNTNDSDSEYTVGTMNYLPLANMTSGSCDRIPVICIYKRDVTDNKEYTCFSISNGIVEQESSILCGRTIVRRYGKVQHKDFRQFCQIVVTIGIPNMISPCSKDEVFASWVDDVMRELKDKGCLRDD